MLKWSNPLLSASDLTATFGMPPEKAIAYLRAKGYVISWNWWEIWQEAQTAAFTVAKVTRQDVLEAIRFEVQRLLDEGITQEQFIRALEPRLKALGWWGKRVTEDGEVVQEGSPWRLKTIYRTNAQNAYMAGRYKTQMENVVNQPYWQYIAVMDSMTRPSHAALNGKVFKWNDPFWTSFYPPLGFNCRCRVRAMSELRVEKLKLKVETAQGKLGERDVQVGIDKATGEVIMRPQTTYSSDGKIISPDPGWSHIPGQITE